MPGARPTRLPPLAGPVASGSTLESLPAGDSSASGRLSSAIGLTHGAGRDTRRPLAQHALVDLRVGSGDVIEGEVPHYVRSAAAPHERALVRRGQQSQHRPGQPAWVSPTKKKPKKKPQKQKHKKNKKQTK